MNCGPRDQGSQEVNVVREAEYLISAFDTSCRLRQSISMGNAARIPAQLFGHGSGRLKSEHFPNNCLQSL